MKMKISGIRGSYTLSFKGNRFYLPKDLCSALDSTVVKGFKASLKQDERYKYLVLIPDTEEQGKFYTIRNYKMAIPPGIKRSLGIEKNGHLVAYLGNLELWGPSWDEHVKDVEYMLDDNLSL